LTLEESGNISRSESQSKALSPGRLGEEAATNYLKQNGYKIVFNNWRCPEGELDIVAMDRKTLVIVEVKTRAAEIAKSFSPFEAVDSKKVAKLKRLANRLIFIERMKIKSNHPQRIRFDVIGVLYSEAGGALSFACHHLREAFDY
jgi:putative endonuclease